MKKFLSLALLVAGVSFAGGGDKYLGTLVPTGGSICNNATSWTVGNPDGGSAYGSSTLVIPQNILADGGWTLSPALDASVADAGFDVPQLAKIRVQCLNPDAGIPLTFVCVDRTSCSATVGVALTGVAGIAGVGPGSAPFIETQVGTTVGQRESLTGGKPTALVCVYSDSRNSCSVQQEKNQ